MDREPGALWPSSKNLELGSFEDSRVVVFSRVAYYKLSGFLGIATLTSSLPLSPMSFKSVPLSELAAYEGTVVATFDACSVADPSTATRPDIRMGG